MTMSSKILFSMIFASILVFTLFNWKDSRSLPITSDRTRTGSLRYSTDAAQTPLPKTPESIAQEDLLATLEATGIRRIPPKTLIQYAQIEVEVESQPMFEPPFLQDVELKYPQLRALKTSESFTNSQDAVSTAKINIAKPPPRVELSNMIFGVATDIIRLNDSLSSFAHWGSDNGARIIALLPSETMPNDIQDVKVRCDDLRLSISIMTSTLNFNDRYFALTKLLYEDRGAAQWAVVIDDDTFFLNPGRLQSMLAKYPAHLPHYIGALSEDLAQIGIWNLMAYGGAGVFLSMPLLSELLPHYDSCMASAGTGDKRIAYCVFSFTTTRMSHEPLLHQVDLRDDASGFYEALRPQPLTVHHWKSWNSYNMSCSALISRICGSDCIFQKYRFADDWQLTNGFSLVRYTHDRGPADIRMEKTWRDSRGKDQEEMYLSSLAPLKPKDSGKIQYLMESALWNEARQEVRQFYVRRIEDDMRLAIIEMVWRKASPPPM